MLNAIKKNFTRCIPPDYIRSVYITLSISEFAIGLTAPIFTFLFFSTSSTLIPAGMSDADRAMLFGIFLAFYKFAGMVSNPVFGSLSDIIGRKAIAFTTVIGILILAIFTIMAMMMSLLWLFIIGACIFTFLFALKPVCAAAINDVSTGQEKVRLLGLMQFYIGIGVSLGPILGGFFGDIKVFGYSYMLPFIILFAVSIFLLIYTKISFNETLTGEYKSSIKEHFNPINLKKLFSSKTLYFLMIIHLLNQFSWGTYYEFIPAVGKTVFGYEVKVVGLLMGLIGFWLILSSGFFIPFFQKHLSNTKLIITSSLIGTFGVFTAYIASFFPNSILANFAIWFSTLPVAAGDVILFCLLVSLFSNSVNKKYQGTMVGIIYIVGMGMWAVAAPIGGMLMKWRMNGALMLCPIAMILLMIFIIFSINKKWFKSLDNEK